MIQSATKVVTIAAALAFVPLALLLGGCSSTLNDSYAQDQLNQARAAYASAKADPHVESVAPDMLLEANLALQDAEKAANADAMTHYSYVAQRKVQTARAMTEGKMAESQVQQMSKENTALLMQKREREARLAREQATTAQQDAQQKAASAEEARRQAELARSDAMHARSEQEELMKELSSLKATQTDRGLVLTLGDVLFETGKAELSPRAKNSIDKLADFLNNHPDRNLMIEGYTDSVGKEAFNQKLSEKRADSVRQALADRGVKEDRVSIKGNGEMNPVASNDSRHGRQLNRRVEVIILHEGAAAGGQVSP